MSPLHNSDVTQLLAAGSEGDHSALEKLVPIVENELHELAHRYMSREQQSHPADDGIGE